MPKITDTYALAYQACGAYFASTRALPTVAAIIARTGRKSPATVAKAVKDWKADLAENYASAPPPIEGIPEALQGTFNQLWQHALKSAHEALIEESTESNRRQDQLIDDQAAKLKKLEEEKADAVTRHNCLVADLLDATTQIADLQSKNDVLKNELSQAFAELEKQKERYERLENQFESQNDWYLRQLAQEKELMEKKYNLADKKPVV